MEENFAYRTPESTNPNTGNHNKKIVSYVILAVVLIILLFVVYSLFKPEIKEPAQQGLSAEELEILNKTGSASDNNSTLTEAEANALLKSGSATGGSTLTAEELQALGESGSAKP